VPPPSKSNDIVDGLGVGVIVRDKVGVLAGISVCVLVGVVVEVLILV